MDAAQIAELLALMAVPTLMVGLALQRQLQIVGVGKVSVLAGAGREVQPEPCA